MIERVIEQLNNSIYNNQQAITNAAQNGNYQVAANLQQQIIGMEFAITLLKQALEDKATNLMNELFTG